MGLSDSEVCYYESATLVYFSANFRTMEQPCFSNEQKTSLKQPLSHDAN